MLSLDRCRVQVYRGNGLHHETPRFRQLEQLYFDDDFFIGKVPGPIAVNVE